MAISLSRYEPAAGVRPGTVLVAAVLAVTSVLNAVLGYHLLRGRQWARLVTIGFCVTAMAVAAVDVFRNLGWGGTTNLGICGGLIVNLLLIGLLSGSAVRGYFRPGPR